jgi:uncharacterized RDD family membrane protein YckC
VSAPQPPPSDPASLRVDSATGVEVRWVLAGPGARAYAFALDWHIRLVLAVAWYVVAAVLYNRSLHLMPLDPASASWFGVVVAPALAIYFLYHIGLETALRGRTPGKRMAGIRIATHDGGTATAGQLLVRNVFRLIDSLPAFYGIGLATALLTRNHARIGDLAAGTVLLYEQSAARAPLAIECGPGTARVTVAHAELMSELLQRWDQLEPGARERLARELLLPYAAEELPRSVPTSDRAGPSAAADPHTPVEQRLRTELERLSRSLA